MAEWSRVADAEVPTELMAESVGEGEVCGAVLAGGVCCACCANTDVERTKKPQRNKLSRAER